MPGELTLEVTSNGGRLELKEVSNTTHGGLEFDAAKRQITIAKEGVYDLRFLGKDLCFLNPVQLDVQPGYPHWLDGLRSFTFAVAGVAADRGKKEWSFSIPTTSGLLDPVIVNQVEGGNYAS